MDIEQMIDKLDDYLPEKRKIHSINVAKSAVRLAKILGCDEKKAQIAGILHDTAKYVKYEDVPSYCEKYSIELDDMEKKSTALSHSIVRSEEHTSELQSRQYLVCRLLLEKKTSPLSYI